MYIEFDINLRDFEFWSGAKYVADKLKDNGDIDAVEDMLDEYYTDIDQVPTDTEINDLFWFEEDTIAEWLGYDSWEDYENNR